VAPGAYGQDAERKQIAALLEKPYSAKPPAARPLAVSSPGGEHFSRDCEAIAAQLRVKNSVPTNDALRL